MVLVVLLQIGAKDLTVHGRKQQKPWPIQSITDFQTNLGCNYSLRLSRQLQPVKTIEDCQNFEHYILHTKAKLNLSCQTNYIFCKVNDFTQRSTQCNESTDV